MERLLATTESTEEDWLNGGHFRYQGPALSAARSTAMADLLVDHGADLEALADWWNPGFYLDVVDPRVAEHLVARGAHCTPHAAAGLGLVEPLKDWISRGADPVDLPGGDGCHPLHFARTLEVAALLVEHGADVDARDEDHRSTPAQWRIGASPEVAQWLLGQGATADVFLAAALGDLELTARLVADDPTVTNTWIGNNSGPFPGIGKGWGGTILQWTLGFNQTPHEVALQRGHRAVYECLLDHSPPLARLRVACLTGNRDLARRVAKEEPAWRAKLDSEDLTLLARMCWETNQNHAAVRLMLELGFPVDAPEANHGHSPLHNAAWCGDLELVELLIDHGHPIHRRDPGQNSPPLGWAIYSCMEGKRHPEGEFGRVVDRLLAAGALFPTEAFPVGEATLDAVIERHLRQRGELEP